MKKLHFAFGSLALACAAFTPVAVAQPFDILTFDPSSAGPWSSVGRTTLMVPKVANGSIKLDGAASSQEYGGFQGVTVTPGENAWILSFPDDRSWDGPEDSSFTYWLAHDDNNFYVGVHVKDEVVTSDDPNGQFWKDDSIEIVVDALRDKLDNNTDNSQDRVGGHNYVNFQGRFSAWDEAAGQKGGNSWASAIDWKYGENDDVFGSGKAVAGGWQMEVRLGKKMFEDPEAGNKLRNGYRMGFNIGLDDDDKRGPGPSGDKSRSQDLEIQYFWANRARLKGFNAEFVASLTPEDLASKTYLQTLETLIDGDGRLTHAATGDIFFGYDESAKSRGKILYVANNGEDLGNADGAIVALLEAKGYTVTRFTSAGSTPEGLREAAAGQNLVILSETIGSTSVVDPAGNATGVFSLKDTDVPVISFEAYMYDNADWTARTEDGSNDFLNWGNTGRADLADPVVHTPQDSIFIRNATHPIAGGMSGKVKVYKVLYSVNFGKPSADADIVATALEDGSYPTIFVYEKGDKLVDGSVAPNKRIGVFLGQNAAPDANWVLDYGDLTEAGVTLFLNTVAYAIGSTGGGGAPTLSVARSGSDIIVTYANGTLQSGPSVTGPWTVETGASPLRAPAGTGTKFFRVRGN